MTTEITKKQAIMLVMLGIILVLVVYVQLLIRPALSDASEKCEEAVALQQQYETLLQQSESYEQNLQSLEAWNKENQGKTELLYPLSETYRIDRFLNFVIRECGASIISLSITDTQQYYVDGEGAIALAAVDLFRNGEPGECGQYIRGQRLYRNRRISRGLLLYGRGQLFRFALDDALCESSLVPRCFELFV